MGRMQRVKGATFERLVANKMRAAFPGTEWKRALQSDGAWNSDVHCYAGHGILRTLWLECNHSNNPPVEAKLEQAENDSERVEATQGAPWRPIVVWRKTGSPVINVSTRLWVLLNLTASRINIYGSYKWDDIVTLELVGFNKLLKYAIEEFSKGSY